MFLGLFRPAAEEEAPPKFTKEQANYRDNPPVYRCGSCRLFIGEKKMCEIVDEGGDPDPGVIEPGDGCDLWNSGPIRQRVRERRFGRGPG
jgi:hypothetical protein